MASTEKRYPRASFSKKLMRICSRLDEASERVIEHVDFLGGKQSPHITILSLWVVGSYARGALECGDLDLVMEYASRDGWEPVIRKISKAFFGTLPLVRYYSGTPAKNTSGVEFVDAALIWSGKGCDWRSAIASIQVDPTAGRATRETDCIPLRGEQLRTYGSEMLEVAQMIQESLLESEFVPFVGEILSPLQDEEMDASDRRQFINLGKKTCELMPSLFRLMQSYEPWGAWDRDSNAQMRCGSTLLRLGRPFLDLNCFDDDPTVRQLALVPHLSARGPNGAWLLRRGANHPDAEAISKRRVFAFFSNGAPDVIHTHFEHWRIRTLDLFESRQDAEDALSSWSPSPNEQLEIVEIKGLEILKLMGVADSIQLGAREFALTWNGTRYLDGELVTMAEIIAALPVDAGI